MIRQLINILPFWSLILLSMLAFTILGYFVAWISTFFYSQPINKDHRHLSNILIGILSGGFSILLAFTIITTWNYQLQARLTTSREADNISVLIHDVAAFPQEIRDKLMEIIRQYTVAVRIDEWKAMKNGKESTKAWNALNDLYASIIAYQPKSDHEKVFYQQLVNGINELLKSRRERLNGIYSIIPESLRESLIFGSIILVIILGIVRGEVTLFFLSPFLFFSIFLGFNLALALSFDYPFSGDIAVTNNQYYSGVLGNLSD